MTFVLRWQDEAAGTPTGANAPDRFKLHVLPPGDAAPTESDAEDDGEITLEIRDAVPGTYIVHIELEEAGDVTAVGNPLGLPLGSQADTGNAFTLDGTYQRAA